MTFRNPLQTIDGSQITIQTAATPPRWVIGGDANGSETISGYSGNVAETTPATLKVDTGSGSAYAELDITSGSLNGHKASTLSLRSRDAANDSGFGLGALVAVTADLMEISTTQGVSLFGGGVINPNQSFTGFAASGLYSGNWSDCAGVTGLGGFTIDASGWVTLQGLIQCTNIAGTHVIASGLPLPADHLWHFFAGYQRGAPPTLLGFQVSGGTIQVSDGSIANNSQISIDGIGYQS